jgi:SAM-dependent methyltransferase
MRLFRNVSLVTTTLEEAMGGGTEGATLAPGSFDVAVMVNVLEHVEDDVALLRTLHALLRPGGTLVLFVPALSWLYGSLDRLVGHKRRYSRATLGSVVRRADFEVETLRYFDVLGVVPWFIAGRVLRQGAFDARAAGLYDRVAVPLGVVVERHLSPPLGKNVVCTSRRR